jgi:hypothetical protein
MNVIEKIYNEETREFTYLMDTGICFHCGRGGTVEILPSELFELNQGALIQNAVKSLNTGDREQLKSGTHSQCWINMFGEEE